MNWETILTIILSIVFGYIINLSTPFLKSYIDRGSLSLRERRLYLLIERYKYIRRMRDNPTTLSIIMFRHIAIILAWLTALLFAIGVWQLLRSVFDESPDNLTFIVRYGFLFFCSYIIFYRILQIVQDTENLKEFQMFKKRIISKMQKLGGNPEDLDKEEETQGG